VPVKNESAEPPETKITRNWLSIVIIAISVCTFIALPIRLLNAGFLPPDDALRYAARAVTGKTWGEIVVMRPEITIDHNAGWNWIQRRIYQATNWEPKRLVGFSVVLMFAVFSIAPLLWSRRPEMWLAAMTLLMLVFPYFAERLLVGRPLWLTATATLILLWLWKEERAGRIFDKRAIVSSALVALCVWIHGSWYLFVLLPFCFFLSRRWRAGSILTGCWLIGSVIGSIPTGHPWRYLYESALIPFLALGQKLPVNALVGEFQPFSGGYPAAVIVAVILGVRVAWRLPLAKLSREPALWLAVIGWALGFKVFRFWLDWGLPAFALWIAWQLQEFSTASANLSGTTARLGIAGVAAFLLLGIVADDRNQRWSRYGIFEAMDARRPEHREWLPGSGGILYMVNMSVFYETFFTNPRGDWRYILGYEPSFMPPEDYAVYKELWETLNAISAVQPWVAKMKPADRLVLLGPENTRPIIPELEWNYVVSNTWVGRKRDAEERE
jgi:hypothetical protein